MQHGDAMLKILPAVKVRAGFSRKGQGYRNDVLVLASNYIEFAVSQWSPMEWAALPCIKAGGRERVGRAFHLLGLCMNANHLLHLQRRKAL